MKIDPSPPECADPQAHLDIWKDKATLGQPSLALEIANLFVNLGAVVVRDADRPHCGCGVLNRLEVILPSIDAFKLIIQDCAGRMDVWFPTMPAGAGIKLIVLLRPVHALRCGFLVNFSPHLGYHPRWVKSTSAAAARREWNPSRGMVDIAATMG